MFINSAILVTGGTGSFGHAFVRMTLERYNPKRIVIFSRDEMKQWEMAKLFEGDSTKAKERLGWIPKITFTELVKEMVVADLKGAERDHLCRTEGYLTYNYHE